MVTLSMTKEARIYNGENTVSSANCARKTGKLHTKKKKKEIRTFFKYHTLFTKYYTQK